MEKDSLENNKNQLLDIKSLFLGSQSENSELLKELVNLTLNSVIETRFKVNSKLDGPIFSSDHINSDQYVNSKSIIIQKTNEMLEYLKRSIQFSSFRSMSYMFGDTTIPSIIGNIATLFYSQTNMIYQLSNTTTPLEYIAIKDFTELIGFKSCNEREMCFSPISNEKFIEFQEIQELECSINPFGHLTSGGSISNIEAYWSSFLNKYLAISIKQALLCEPRLSQSKNLLIDTKYIYSSDYSLEVTSNDTLENNYIDGNDCSKVRFIKLVSLSSWDLLNLDIDQVVRLPFQIANQNQIKYYEVFEILKIYHPINTGICSFVNQHHLNLPIFIAPKSAHYSISKASSLLGLGVNTGIRLVDLDAKNRMSISHLESIVKECSIKRIPILNVTCVMGSTQESAVDPLDKVLELRDKYRKKKRLDWSIHSDGAYGALFMTCIKDDFPMLKFPDENSNTISSITNENLPKNQVDYFEPQLLIKEYLVNQFNSLKYSDTITIDPHKHGFINFSTGGLLFRNEKFKYILSMTTMYIGGFSIENLGTYGIEGSRCGQSAAAVYLTNSIIRPSKGGYGRLLSLSLLNSKLFYLGLLSLCETKSSSFKIVPLAKPPKKSVFNYLVKRIFKISNISEFNDDLVFPHLDDIKWDSELIKVLSNIGGDLNVVCFTVNPNSNSDYQQYIQYMDRAAKRFTSNFNGPTIDLHLSLTTFSKSLSNTLIFRLFKWLGISSSSLPQESIQIPFLRSITIDPFSTQTMDSSVFSNIFKLLNKEFNKLNK